MNTNRLPDMAGFFLAGISYQKTNAPARGWFAIDQQQYATCLAQAPAFGIGALFILSTCNRTEIYGFAADRRALINVLCTATKGSAAAFTDQAYLKKGREAITHLFQVGAGLDSQLLGDYEIVGQLKQAVKFARDRGFINTFLDRLVSSVLQSSKDIKNNTALSKGAVSAAFAAVQYIKAAVTRPADRRILLVGAGKIGCSTCKNLVDYLGATQIVVVNRSEAKAAGIAAALDLTCAPMAQLAEQVALADVIIVTTNAPAPLILRSDLEHTSHKLIIDLSLPANVETAVKDLPHIQLIGLDEISKSNDHSLHERQADIPKANAIIARHLDDFLDWCRMRKNIPILKAISIRLGEIAAQQQRAVNDPEMSAVGHTAEQKIRRVIGGTAEKMRADNHSGCYYIEAINELLMDFI